MVEGSSHRQRTVRSGVNGQDTNELLMDYIRENNERQKDVAAAIHRFSDVAEEFVKVIKPAAVMIADGGRRLDNLCKWLRKWGLVVLWSCPVVAMAVGAITPNVAARLDQFIKLLGH